MRFKLTPEALSTDRSLLALAALLAAPDRCSGIVPGPRSRLSRAAAIGGRHSGFPRGSALGRPSSALAGCAFAVLLRWSLEPFARKNIPQPRSGRPDERRRLHCSCAHASSMREPRRSCGDAHHVIRAVQSTAIGRPRCREAPRSHRCSKKPMRNSVDFSIPFSSVGIDAPAFQNGFFD